MAEEKSRDQWLSVALNKLTFDGFHIIEDEFMEGFLAVAMRQPKLPSLFSLYRQHYLYSFFFTFAEWPTLSIGEISAYSSHAVSYAKGFCSRPNICASPIEVAWTFAVAIVDRMDDSLEHEVLSQKPIVHGALGDAVEIPIVYDRSTERLLYNAKRPFWRLPAYWGLKKMIRRYLEDPGTP